MIKDFSCCTIVTKPSIPPDFSISAMILPTSIAKASVKSIHPCESKEAKSVIKASREPRGEKSCKSRIPKIMPLKSERSTFLK